MTHPTRPTQLDSALTYARFAPPWPTVARVVWAVWAVTLLIFFSVASPARLNDLNTTTPTYQATYDQLYRLTSSDVRLLQQFGVSVIFYALSVFVVEAIYVLAFCIPALLLFWRKFDERIAVFVAFMYLTYGFIATPNLTAWAVAHPAWRFIWTSLLGLILSALVIFLYIFPDGRFVPRWTRSLALIWTGLALAGALLAPTVQTQQIILAPLVIVFCGIGLWVQIFRYRQVSSAAQRQQTKWFVFGFAICLLLVGAGLIFLSIPAFLDLGVASLLYRFFGATLFMLGTMVAPLSVSLSILRYRLFDIDLIIRRTVLWAIISGLGLGVYLLAVGATSYFFSSQPDYVIPLVALIIVAFMARPLYRRLDSLLGRVWSLNPPDTGDDS